METQLHAKNKKKYRTAKAVGPERMDGRTDERTDESEFIGSFRSLKTSGEPKNSQNCQFWQRNDQILALNGQNFAISEFSRHIEYDFFKEDHKNNFHTKN